MKAKVAAKSAGQSFACTDLKLVLPVFFFWLFNLIIAPAYSQTSPLSFATIPAAEHDFIAPGRGAEQWHNANGAIAYPSDEDPQQSLDVYYRFTWNRLEGADAGQL